MNLGSQLYTYYVAMSLFWQWKETILSKMGICLKEEQDGQASEWPETEAAPGISAPEMAAFLFRMLP